MGAHRHSSGGGHSSNPEPPNDRCAVTGKIIHATQKAAIHAIIGFRRRKGTRFGRHDQLQAYYCGDCGGFHNGHANAKQNSRNSGKYRR